MGISGVDPFGSGGNTSSTGRTPAVGFPRDVSLRNLADLTQSSHRRSCSDDKNRDKLAFLKGHREWSHTDKPRNISPVRNRLDLSESKPNRDCKESFHPAEETENLVLRESIGPIHENPFIKLEKERRRRKARNASKPIQQILEMYNNVPGIRTIRAENIIIIESDPDYFPDQKGLGSPKNGIGNSLTELLARRGSNVAEIRASEVVIYEPAFSKSEENLSTLSTEDTWPGTDCRGYHGRVSKLLEKFDQNYVKSLRSRSTENLLLDSSEPYHRERENKPPSLPKSPVSVTPTTTLRYSYSQEPVGRTLTKSEDSAFQFHENEKPFAPKYSSRPSLKPSSPTVGLPSVSEPNSPVSPKLIPSSHLNSPGHTVPSSPLFTNANFLPFESTVSTNQKPESPTVSIFKNRFHSPLAAETKPETKLKDSTSRAAGNTFTVSPKAKSVKLEDVHSENLLYKDRGPVANGQIAHSDSTTMQEEGKKDIVSITNGDSGKVPSLVRASNNEFFQEANTWRPKSASDIEKSDHPFLRKPQQSSNVSKAVKSSATSPETLKLSHKEEGSSATLYPSMQVSASTSLNDTFEIKQAAKPDINSIPDTDVQAKALANIKMQSKNSFVVIPKKRPNSLLETKDAEEKSKMEYTSTSVVQENKFVAVPTEQPGQPADDKPISTEESLTLEISDEERKKTDKLEIRTDLPPSYPSTEKLPSSERQADLEHIQVWKSEGQDPKVPAPDIHNEDSKIDEMLPVTNIDDIVDSEDTEVSKGSESALKLNDSTVPPYQPHQPIAQNSVLQRKTGNTFTVVPKRKTTALQQDSSGTHETPPKNGPAEGLEAPHAKLGMLLKKRYPGVNEIEVVGGYLSLEKSCLSNGSTRKKMKISFNEASLQTTFEYPSEGSLVEEGHEEESESESESEEEEKTSTFFIPRPSNNSLPVGNSPLRTSPLNSGMHF
ncbi:taperin [Latimeria chalumnae]|uniref:taperin n=1 Tax=Latimeria chalumnae TaxID=7897 RepID=UPI00313BDE80